MNLPEYVADGAWETVRRLFALAFRLLIDTGGQSIGIRQGGDTLTWAGGTPESAAVTITHGLGSGVAPRVQATATSRVGAVAIIVWTSAPTATQVTVRGRTVDGSNPAAAATATFEWTVSG